MRQRGWWLVAALGGGLAGGMVSRTEAQLAPVGIPRGLIRFEFSGDLDNYDHRYRDGVREEYAADFAGNGFGSNLIAGLEPAETAIGQLIGNGNYRLNLGNSSASALVNIGTGTIGLGYGLSSRLSLFVNVPIVRMRVQPTIKFDSTGGTAGLNPYATLGCTSTTFCGQLQTAIATLGSKVTAGDYDTNATTKALAQATVASGNAFLNLLSSPDSATPFLPIDTSSAGAGLASAASSLQNTLTTLGVPGVTQALALPSALLSPQDIESFLTNRSGLVAARKFEDEKLSRMGDVTLGAVYTLVNRWDRGSPGGFRAAIHGTVRLPTGLQYNDGDFFHLRTGEGHTEISLALTADLGRGVFGARLEGGYTLRLAATRTLRVSLPSQPIALLSRKAEVRLNPGDLVSASAQPYLRLTPAIAVVGGVSYWRRGTDQASLTAIGTASPGLNSADLTVDSKASALAVSGGISYANAALRQPDRPGLPIEASWSYEAVVSATGGRVPQGKVSRVELRLYYRLRR